MDLETIIQIVARVLLGGGFLVIGLRNTRSIGGISMPLQGAGIPFPKIAAGFGVAMQIVFGAMLLSGLWVFWASIGLLVFTILATALFHNFLAFTAPERANHFQAFLANVLLSGGILAMAATGL